MLSEKGEVLKTDRVAKNSVTEFAKVVHSFMRGIAADLTGTISMNGIYFGTMRIRFR